MKTFFFIVLCLCEIYFPSVQSQCGWAFQQVEIKDVDVGKEIFSYDLGENEFVGWSITALDGGLTLEKAHSYFKNSQKESTFSFETTEKFSDLNKDSYTGNDFLTITLGVQLKCGSKNDNSSLLVTITNTNQNAPEFSQKNYVYSVPIPIMPRTDFSLFGDDIIKATDIDFSTTSISFSIEPSDFAVSSTRLENKTFQAVFSANKILRFTEDKMYTLKATDSGSPAQTTSVQVTLKANTSESDDAPSFSKEFYTYNYTTELIPTSEAIVVNSNKPNKAYFAWKGDYSEYFNVAFDNSSRTFSISTLSDTPLPENAPSPIILTLSYISDTTANTVILITMVKDEIIPAFSQEYYQGTYDVDTNAITWKEEIKVTGASTVTLSGGKADLFTIDEATKKINPKNPLKTSDFDNSNIVLTLKASSKTSDVHSTVIISLPTATELKFESAYYSASYSVKDNNGVVNLNDDIVFEYGSDLASIIISVDNSYSENFKFERDKLKWIVVVKKPLDTSVLNSNTEIAIPITAEVEGDSAKATAILILKLPEKVEIKFGSSKYTAKYNKGTNLDDVSLTSNITIEGVEKNDISFSLDDFGDNFNLVLNEDSSGYKINVKKNLDDSVFKSNIQLIITITASTKDGSASAKAVLVLDLQKQTSTIAFKNKYYVAEYILDSNFKASVDLVGDRIQVSGADPTDLLLSLEEYQNNFILEYNTVSSAYEIKVNQSLDASVLASNTQLVITIKAFKTDKSASDSTVLLLKLPLKTSSITFESKHYTAEYKVGSDSKAIVSFNGDALKISGATSSELQFSLDGFGENFKVEYNSDSSAYELKVTQNLDGNVLASKTQLIITVTAYKVDGSAFDSTVVIIQLPEKASSISFESKYYAAQYILTSDFEANVKLSGDGIKISGASFSELQFSLGDFSDNFEVTNTDSEYKIMVKNILSEPVLASKTELVITITAAKIDGSAHDSTVLILELPKKSSVINFESKHYAAEYILDSDSKGSVKFSGDPIKISGGDHSEIEFSLESFSENFAVVYNSDDAAYTIKVNKLLDSKVLSNKQLVISITASKTDKSAFDTAVLILTLPDKSSSITFEHKHYSADYIVDLNAKASVRLSTEAIKISDATPSELTFTLEDYGYFFDLKYTEELSGFQVMVTNNLDASVLALKTQLVITITAYKTNGGASDSTVLLLKLPEKTSSIKFEHKHYTAEYNIGSDSKSSVTLSVEDGIKIYGATSSELQLSFENYSENFNLEYKSDISAYEITVKEDLNETLLAENEQLVLTIKAYKKDGTAFDSTVVVIMLPEKSSLLAFESRHYTGEYIEESDSKASVKMYGNSIKISRATSSKLTFSFEGYEDNFGLNFDSTTSSYGIIVTKPLDKSLFTNIQLAITITARSTSKLSASTVLALSLPINETLSPAFENDYYVATYLEESLEKHQIKVATTIKINDPLFAVEPLSFTGYNENIVGSCDSSSLQCTVTLTQNLNSTVLSSNSEILIPVIASSSNGEKKGKTVLMVKLPLANSTFTFANQYYYGYYTLQQEDNEKATVSLNNTISFDNVDISDVTITLDQYSNEFSFTLDQNWKLEVKNNLNTEILSKNTELIISITAKKIRNADYSKATLVLKLPDKTTMAFLMPQFSSQYVLKDDSALVVITDESGIQTTDNSVQVTLDSYSENFEVTLDSNLKWTVNVKKPLDKSVFLKNSELRIIMTITKVGVKYGEAALIIKLPDVQFSKGFYIIEYVENNGVASVDGEEINVLNVNAKDVKLVISSEYDKYFYTTLNGNKWTVNVSQSLPAEIKEKYEILLPTITAVGKSDNQKLATSTLVIKLSAKNSTNAENVPIFTHFAFHGDYKTSDDSLSKVELTDIIGFTNSKTVEITSVDIEESTSKYASNFKAIKKDDGTVGIEVLTNLSDDVLEAESSIALTLIASSKQGNNGYAVLVIKLPSKNSTDSENVPIFTHFTFYGDYKTSEDSLSKVELTDIIGFTNSKTVEITSVNIEKSTSKYASNFKAMKKDDDSVEIEVLTNLSEDVLKAESSIALTLIATSKQGKHGYAVLVIKLPSKNSTDSENVPLFTQLTFHGDYKTSEDSLSTVELTDIIGFINSKTVEITSVKIEESTSKYASNFKAIKKDDGSVEIEVLTNLSQDVLEAESSIALTLIASSKQGDNGYAVLVINLPKAKREPSIHFDQDEKILFSGSYKNGTFILPDIPILTNSTDDSEISVEVTTDLDIDNKYFRAKCSNKRIIMDVDEFPDEILKKHAVIPLKLAIKDKTTGDTVYAVLNINIDDNSENHNGDDNADSTSGDRKGLLAAVIVLACLLIGLIATASFLWYYKLRHAKYSKMDDTDPIEPETKNIFAKNLTRQPSTPVSVNNLRRPTGLPIRTESPTEDASSDFSLPRALPVSEPDKKVLFDDHVQNIEPYKVENEVSSEGLQNVAARRPTKFVFGYPLEEGVLDFPSERRESSDYIGVDPETKKSVLFDENVERMDIETVEDDTDDESDTSDSETKEHLEIHDVTNNNKTDESELKIEPIGELPSQIFKEIF